MLFSKPSWHTCAIVPKKTICATTVPLTLGPQGRVVIPAAVRRELGFKTGDRLVGRLEEDRLVIESVDVALERIRKMFDVIPRDVSLVDELIAERREEARREEEEMARYLAR